MSFSATGAHRPFQSKAKKNPFLRRSSSSSSAFANHPRRKSTSTGEPALKRARTEDNEHGDEERLSNTGIVTSIPPPGTSQDVISLMGYIQEHMFAEIPERSAGMNSVRIAEILNFRKRLPPIVSLAHLLALSASTTSTEREIAQLVQAGRMRRMMVLGRGKGGAAVGDGLVLASDWERIVNQDDSLGQDLKDKYISLLSRHPTSPSISASELVGTEASQLVSAGFLTSTSALSTSSEVLSRPGAFSLGTSSSVATAGSSAATGSLAAVGGQDAIHSRGGGGGGLAGNSRSQTKVTADLTFALPYTGAHLKLLTEARTHFLQLLSKSSPKYKEAARDMLRERWDGGIPTDDPASRAKRARGEWIGILPGKTKKWKSFYGMEFAWVLEECLGSGSVECFETGSVGLGVRAI